jgi:hypothetical protein
VPVSAGSATLARARLVAFENLKTVPETTLQIDGLRQAIGEIEMQAILMLARIDVDIGKDRGSAFRSPRHGIVPGGAVGRL